MARVPIVPGAVVFDLAPGRERPGPRTGRAACDDASDAPVAEGRVGAGSGATVGKVGGPAAAAPGGLGSWALAAGAHRVAALAVVNALGRVVGPDGTVVAGGGGGEGDAPAFAAGGNTTLAVVATDAPLGAVGLRRMARVATNALARRIHPVHTPFDGDVVFAVSTADEEREMDPGEALGLFTAAQEALEVAIVRAVTEGER